MNRLAPLITRRVGRHAPPPAAIAVPLAGKAGHDLRGGTGSLIEDLKAFGLVWLGGLIFFYTFLS